MLYYFYRPFHFGLGSDWVVMCCPGVGAIEVLEGVLGLVTLHLGAILGVFLLSISCLFTFCRQVEAAGGVSSLSSSCWSSSASSGSESELSSRSFRRCLFELWCYCCWCGFPGPLALIF